MLRARSTWRAKAQGDTECAPAPAAATDHNSPWLEIMNRAESLFPEAILEPPNMGTLRLHVPVTDVVGADDPGMFLPGGLSSLFGRLATLCTKQPVDGMPKQLDVVVGQPDVAELYRQMHMAEHGAAWVATGSAPPRHSQLVADRVNDALTREEARARSHLRLALLTLGLWPCMHWLASPQVKSQEELEDDAKGEEAQ